MKNTSLPILFCACLMVAYSCKKDEPVTRPDVVVPTKPENGGGNTNPSESDYSLGDLAKMQGIKLGAAFTYGEYTNNPQVAGILKKEFMAVTFGNEMKHDAIVKANGTMDFSRADQMVKWAKDCDTELFGHVLGWHSQQQTDYLRSVIASAPADDSGSEGSAIDGGIDFEKYAAGSSAQLLQGGEIVQINGQDYVSVTDEYAHGGSLSLKMDNADGHSDNAWDVQVITKAFSVSAGHTYRIEWYGRASAEADIQTDIRGDGDTQYRSSAYGHYAKTGTDWTYQCMEYKVSSGSTLSIGFYGATEAVTYYIDDIKIIPLDGGSISDAQRAAVDNALKTYVYGMVEHFDVYAWDVVNETFADGRNGAFRTEATTNMGNHTFVWGTYYPSTKDWVDRVFEYAADACKKYGKDPVLYINDYNLETDPGKRRGLCEYAKGNPNVTGVSTQMHIDMATPDLKNKITETLKELAATGKMVRIAELDIKTQDINAQAGMFRHVFEQYIAIVPEAQRGGITFWGINDKDSWVGEENHPLLWMDSVYNKKPAYDEIYNFLLELNGLSPDKE